MINNLYKSVEVHLGKIYYEFDCYKKLEQFRAENYIKHLTCHVTKKIIYELIEIKNFYHYHQSHPEQSPYVRAMPVFFNREYSIYPLENNKSHALPDRVVIYPRPEENFKLTYFLGLDSTRSVEGFTFNNTKILAEN